MNIMLYKEDIEKIVNRGKNNPFQDWNAFYLVFQ